MDHATQVTDTQAAAIQRALTEPDIRALVAMFGILQPLRGRERQRISDTLVLALINKAWNLSLADRESAVQLKR